MKINSNILEKTSYTNNEKLLLYKNLSQNEKMTMLMKHKKPFSITRVLDKQNDENKINHVRLGYNGSKV